MMESQPMPKDEGKKEGEFDKYELEDAVRTLERAEEIKANSKMMDALQPMLQKKMQHIKSVSALRKVASKKIVEEATKEKQNAVE